MGFLENICFNDNTIAPIIRSAPIIYFFCLIVLQMLYSSKTNSNDTKFGFFSPNISKSCSKIIDKESLSNQISFSMEVVVNSLVMSARKHSDRSKQLKIIFHRVCVLSFFVHKKWRFDSKQGRIHGHKSQISVSPQIFSWL